MNEPASFHIESSPLRASQNLSHFQTVDLLFSQMTVKFQGNP